ncbi:hypothetical protein QYF61_007869 [Mycteria americana]|uniref:Uncharacterized protein n=1 Tax=Mycteria americana TaxID=33587 RepID=A0AAN7RUE9_MYCAM|nr:hypothetical protein QYF61_007869 [Mycteria americana]
MSQEEQMKEVDLFSLQKRRLRREVIAIFSHLKGQEDDDRLFSMFTKSKRRKISFTQGKAVIVQVADFDEHRAGSTGTAKQKGPPEGKDEVGLHQCKRTTVLLWTWSRARTPAWVLVTLQRTKFCCMFPAISAKQSQFPQTLLIRLLLQTLHHLRCPSLHPLQHLNVSLVVGGPKLNTGFEPLREQGKVTEGPQPHLQEVSKPEAGQDTRRDQPHSASGSILLADTLKEKAIAQQLICSCPLCSLRRGTPGQELAPTRPRGAVKLILASKTPTTIPPGAAWAAGKRLRKKQTHGCQPVGTPQQPHPSEASPLPHSLSVEARTKQMAETGSFAVLPLGTAEAVPLEMAYACDTEQPTAWCTGHIPDGRSSQVPGSPLGRQLIHPAG